MTAKVLEVQVLSRAPVTAIVAQLVRASVCGTEGRGFKSHRSPHTTIRDLFGDLFMCVEDGGRDGPYYNYDEAVKPGFLSLHQFLRLDSK